MSLFAVPRAVPRMVNYALLLITACALAACAATPPGDDALARRVDGLIAAAADAPAFSGAVVLARQGRVVYARGFGMANHEAGVAFTPDTPTDGASLAKTFTAAGVLWLANDGRVDLDAPVTRYVPAYPHAATTVRQLLAHSNGLPDYAFFDPHFAPDALRTTARLLRVLAKELPAPSFAPGSRFEYSNVGYDAAAAVIEAMTGQDYPRFVAERFFTPLGMRASFARPGRLADWRGVRTMGYRWRDGAWQLHDVFDNEAFYGASNLYFSANDLSRWASAQAAGSAVPPAVAAAGRQHPLIAGRPSSITLASWYCDDDGQRCHYTGSYNAFHSLVYFDRASGDSAVMVSNGTLPAERTINLQRELVAALAGAPAQPDPATGFIRFDDKTRPTVAGTYRGEGLGTLRLRAQPTADAPGRLSAQIDNGPAFAVFPVSRDWFYMPGTDYWLAFSGTTGAETLHLRSMYRAGTARRIMPP